MAPITKFLLTFSLAASAVSGNLLNTRSRQHAALASKRANLSVQAQAVADAVLEERTPEPEADDIVEIADFEHYLERGLDGEDEDSALEKRSSTVKVSKMPSGFKGTNKGIGSWFRANSGQDSTNGQSWCGIWYTDDMPGFAPKFGTMSPNHATYSSDESGWRSAGTKYCGLEAKVTYKGKTQLMYIIDAFDDRWVRSKGSIDILKGAWAKLYGKSTNNKDIVMKNLTWKLTGRRNNKYKFQG